MREFDNIEAVRNYARHTSITAGSGLGTQGRKGKKLSRYNLGLTAENKEFIQIVSKASGQTQNAFINFIIDVYRQAHPEAVDRAREVLKIFDKK